MPAGQAAAIRRRFPAVPGAFSQTVAVDGDPSSLVAVGMPRPKLNGVPIPATSLVDGATVNIIESDEALWLAALAQRRCDLCLEPLDREPRMYVAGEADPGRPGWVRVRGGMHRRCFRATCHWCVHIRERLLDGSMCAGSIALADTRNADRFEIICDAQTPGQDTPIGEYRVALWALVPEWPYRSD